MVGAIASAAAFSHCMACCCPALLATFPFSRENAARTTLASANDHRQGLELGCVEDSWFCTVTADAGSCRHARPILADKDTGLNLTR